MALVQEDVAWLHISEDDTFCMNIPTSRCKKFYVSFDHFTISQEASEYEQRVSASPAIHRRSRKLVHPSAGVISRMNLGPPVLAGLILSLVDFEQV
jgi:hypothetical protein